MEDFKFYDKMLYTVLTKNYVSKAAMFVLGDCAFTVYRNLKQALDANHIRQTKETEYKGKEKYRNEYYTITPEGIRYLVKECKESLPWLQYISEDVVCVRIKNKRKDTQGVKRFLKISSGNVFAESLGATTKPIFYPDGIVEHQDGCLARCKQGTLASLVITAMNKYNANVMASNNRNIKEDQITFASSLEVKARLSDTSTHEENVLDVNSCRFAGLLESCYCSMALYVGSLQGMSWQKKFVIREVATHVAYNKKESRFKTVTYNDNRAALLVTNSKMFADIFFDKKKKRTGDDGAFGSGYTHFYVFPFSPEGREQAKHILSHNAKREREALLKASETSQLFKANHDSFSSELFPLLSGSEAPVFVGEVIDVIQINRLFGMLSRYPELKFEILCYEWQVEYYKRLFPEIRYYTMSLK